MSEILLRTPLHEEHVRLGAKMVPFAGYDMPVQYPTGVLTEHNWTRAHAGLFDVSHMGQCFIISDSFENAATAFETLVPADVKGLAPLQQRYSQLLNEAGGILDDLMISRSAYPDRLYVVVNAGCKEADYKHIAARLPQGARLERLDNEALLALQGPDAEAVLCKLNPKVRDIRFMHFELLDIAGIKNAHISRSGYTGEDGFEISVSAMPMHQSSGLRCSKMSASNPLALARAIRCALRRASASMAMTWTTPSRPMKRP